MLRIDGSPWSRGTVLWSLVGAIGLGVGCRSGLERRFQDHIDILASDRLEGRGVGSKGIELAAQYIAEQFEAIGLEPAGDAGTYFQTFSMTLRRRLTESARLSFTGDAVPRTCGKDFIPFSFSSNEAFSGALVFCGYGITEEERKHDDFGHVDLTGKVALMLRGEPSAWADAEGFPTPNAMLRNKVYNAKDRGAAAVLIVNAKPEDDEPDALVEFDAENPDAYGVPAFHVTRALTGELLGRAGAETLDALQEQCDQSRYATAALKDLVAEGAAGFESVTAPTHNVLGLLRGAGPKSRETIVIGAHYDHLGVRRPMMRRFKAGKRVEDPPEPQIHNGADDNASGTSGLIEIARLFSSAPQRPERSVLFVAFTGEESGLHGSKYYVEHPPVPLDDTVAMLNMDMIGRLKPEENKVLVFGTECGDGFEEALTEAAREVGLSLGPSPDTGGRSDHAPFVRRRIPSMHFYTGNHGDYHKPSDDAHLINAKDGARVVRMVHGVADRLASRSVRPAFQEVALSTPRPDGGGTPSYRVVMGLAPGYAEDGQPGMAVEGVTPEGPAAMAGMKAGDRIVRIGDRKVDNIYDYMAATRGNQPGDTVSVMVLRGGQEVELRVTLASAR